MPYSLSQAAEACGINRTTVLRSIKAGKISASRDAHQQWQIEPSELHRVYPPADARTGNERRNNSHYRAQMAETALTVRVQGLRDTADLLRAQLDDTRKDWLAG